MEPIEPPLDPPLDELSPQSYSVALYVVIGLEWAAVVHVPQVKQWSRNRGGAGPPNTKLVPTPL